MKTRIGLIILIVIGLAICGLNLVVIKGKVLTLQSRLTTETAAHQHAEAELAGTKSNLEKTLLGLKQCQASLEVTLIERDKAIGEAASYNKRAEELSQALSTTRQRLEEAKNELARYYATGRKPEEIAGLVAEIKTLQKELTSVSKEREAMAVEIASLRPPDPPVRLPADLRGKVVACDPKWRFIVLDAGKNQGVLPEGELLVSRNGQLVAKVKVRSVEKDRSVASVMAGWELSEIVEGDLLIPAHPRS